MVPMSDPLTSQSFAESVASHQSWNVIKSQGSNLKSQISPDALSTFVKLNILDQVISKPVITSLKSDCHSKIKVYQVQGTKPKVNPVEPLAPSVFTKPENTTSHVQLVKLDD